MNFIKRLYDWILAQAETPYSEGVLLGLAVVESIIFPIPPDVLLMPMCLGRPRRSLRFAAVCTIGSLIGGVIGYSIGHWLWWAGPETFSGLAQWFFAHVPGFQEAEFEKVRQLYSDYGWMIVFAAAFTPIPFKIITITAGAFDLFLPMFIVAAVIGRAARFFLVAGLLQVWGEPLKAFIERYFNLLTLLFLILLIGGFILLKFLFQ